AEIAKEFGVPILINASLREGSLREAAADMNVPVIVYEAGEALRFDEASIRAGVKGVVRTMRAIGMLPKVRNRNKFSPIVARSSIWTRASQSGVLRSAVALGAQVNKGQTLAIIADPFGDNEEAIDAPTDGYVIGRTNLPLVHEGDALFHIVSVTGKQAVARDLDGFEPISEYEKGATAELTDEPPISP
ncbi:MAG: succinylglutamate desuccinylase/aspartoacylase family protein, partial [Rhodospirillales bacterium]